MSSTYIQNTKRTVLILHVHFEHTYGIVSIKSSIMNIFESKKKVTYCKGGWVLELHTMIKEMPLINSANNITMVIGSIRYFGTLLPDKRFI